MTPIEGTVDKEFDRVKEVFDDNFEQGDEVGASFCVYHDHEKVVDLWGGYKDSSLKEKWVQDTLVPVFSTTKTVGAACLAMLHSRGHFDYTDKVSDHWPEFGQNGKEDITIRELLQHRTGLAAIDEKLTPEIIADHERLDKILAEQEPNWKPGEYQGYHVWTIGWYMSALLSRIDPDGRRLGQFIEEEINQRIDGEFYLGIDDDFDLERVATLIPFSRFKMFFSMPFKFIIEFFKPWSLTYKAMLNPSFASSHTNFNKREILELEMGSGNGVTNARSLAEIMDGLIDEDSPLQLDDLTLKEIERYPDKPKGGFEDKVFKQEAFRFHCGFMKPSEEHHFSDEEEAFGGFGAGGSFVVVEPKKKLTMAYTMNKMRPGMKDDEREIALREAVYGCL